MNITSVDSQASEAESTSNERSPQEENDKIIESKIENTTITPFNATHSNNVKIEKKAETMPDPVPVDKEEHTENKNPSPNNYVVSLDYMRMVLMFNSIFNKLSYY